MENSKQIHQIEILSFFANILAVQDILALVGGTYDLELKCYDVCSYRIYTNWRSKAPKGNITMSTQLAELQNLFWI